MKFLDLFAGVGGFRLGLEQAGHECVGFCEIDKFARASYKAIHDTEGELEFHDITSVSDESIRGIGAVDIICGGFPCQAFSVAGKRRGFEDTRGTLFFEIARFASILRPKYLFLENVKGLLNHDKGRTFRTILATLDELRYDAEWCLLNSKNFGVPQNRERVFIIGHLRGAGGRAVFPLGGQGGSDVEESQKREKKINIVGTTLSTGAKGTNSRSLVYDTDGLMSTLDATMYKQPKQIVVPISSPDRLKKQQNGRRFKSDGEPMFTLTAQDRHGVIIAGNEPKIIQRPRSFNKGGEHSIAPTLTKNSYQENNYLSNGIRIRKITPRECWRLQGFPDWAFDKAQAVNSDSQLYKQAGNSVTVNVIYEIAKNFE